MRSHFVCQLDERTTNKACVFQDLLFLLFLAPEVSERVDDHTKDEVQNDNNDDEEKQQVVNNSSHKQWFLQIYSKYKY